MFDIGWSELVVIGVVALVVIGPKDLPRVMRTVGQWMAKAKRMGREFQNQFNEALREAELDDVKKEVEQLGNIDPLADVHKDMAALDAHLRSDPTKVVVPPIVEVPPMVQAPPVEAPATEPAKVEAPPLAEARPPGEAAATVGAETKP